MEMYWAVGSSLQRGAMEHMKRWTNTKEPLSIFGEPNLAGAPPETHVGTHDLPPLPTLELRSTGGDGAEGDDGRRACGFLNE